MSETVDDSIGGICDACLEFHTILRNRKLKLLPCPVTGSKMFCAGPNFLSQPQNLTGFGASSITFVPAQKSILLNAIYLFVRHKIFVTGTICN